MFGKAENLIPLLKKAYDDALKEYDVLIMPTIPSVAPKLPKEPLTIKGMSLTDQDVLRVCIFIVIF
jgi:amidase